MSSSSDQNVVGLNDGSITSARAMVRLVFSIRWNPDRVAAISGVPMNFKSQNLDVIEKDSDPHAHPEEHDESMVENRSTRRLQISEKHLADFGYTDGCPRCSAQRLGRHVQARDLRHNARCRQRIYEAIRQTGGDPTDKKGTKPEMKVPDGPNQVEQTTAHDEPSTPKRTPPTPRPSDSNGDLDRPDVPEHPLDKT